MPLVSHVIASAVPLGQYIVDALSAGSLYAVFALGLALIFGVMKMINFAHGALIMAGSYALIVLSQSASPIVKLLVVVATVVALAIILERVAFRPLRLAPPTTLLVTSFAVSSFLIALATSIFGDTPRSTIVSSWLSGEIHVQGVYVARISVLNVIFTVAVVIALVMFLRRTRIGLQMRAAAENFQMARALGVRANVVVASTFAASGVLAAIAAFLYIAQGGTVYPSIGTIPLLYGFVAVILGGMGSVVGAVVGGLAVGALTEILQAALPLSLSPYRDAFVFGAVFVVLVFRPEGLAGARGLEERV